jgi:serine/threonine protein kinase
VERYLDEGSAGEVYGGQNVWIGRSVAIKRLHPQHQDNATITERFLLEGRIGGRVDHPNIVQTLDMAREPSDGSFFIVQELLCGMGLRALLDQSPRLAYRDALDLLVPLMGAMVAVHQQGIVHRDIKPENIFLMDSSMGHRIPKLLDFGIAKVRLNRTLTQVGSMLGTVDYMAPEQIEGRKDVDRRADVWAVGVLAYELLTGTCPFTAPSPTVALTRIIAHHPPSVHELVPEVPPALSFVVERALRKDRQERYESILQMLEEIVRWSVSSANESDRAISARHRTSLPALLEQKVRTGFSSVAPASIRASLMSAHRSGQFRMPEGLRELAAFMDGSRAVRPEEDEPSHEEIVCDADYDVRSAVQEPVPASATVPCPAGEFEGCASTVPPDGQAEVHEDWEVDELVAEAYSCLRKNAFSEAYEIAERAICRLRSEADWPEPSEPSEAPSSEGDRLARLLLLQAEAAYWRGLYDVHEACVIEAMTSTARFGRDWFKCVAELAESASRMGPLERLTYLAQEVSEASVTEASAPEYVIASCRLGIALQRAGWPEHVEAVLGRLSPEMWDLAERSPTVRAWLCLFRSELARHTGDHAHSLELTSEAVAAFHEAGDVRRACVYREGIAQAQMRLGGYESARALLRTSLDEASAMNLADAATIRLRFGITLARLGEAAEGKDCITRTLRVYVRRGDWAGECAARVYLAEILWLQGDHVGAEREAQAAVERAHTSPVLHVEALGMLAMTQLDRPMESFMAASQAMELLQFVGGADGEARIRLAYALALSALGHREAASTACVDGRDRILERASRISDESWRRSFLERVPEHARTLDLAGACS